MDQGLELPPHVNLPPHPPSKVREWLVTILVAGLLLTVAVMQRPAGPDPAKLAAAKAGTKVEPVGIDPLVAVGKGLLWWKWSTKEADPMFLEKFGDIAHGAAEKFRMAIVAGEYIGDEAREKRFTELEEKLATDSVLRGDIALVRKIKGGEGTPEAAAVTAFTERHGWFARAVLRGTDPAMDAAFQAETNAHGERIVLTLAIAGLVFLVCIVAGIASLIVMIVRTATGRVRSRFVRTPRELGGDGGLWIETFGVFLAGFLVVHLIGALLDKMAGPRAAWPTGVVLLMQWSLVGVIFWPRLRGMTRERFLGELGWHRGRGVAREIGCGVLGYLAGLPVYFLVALIVTVVSMIVEAVKNGLSGGGGDDAPLPDNKVFDLIGSSGGWMLVLLATLIVVWAPLVEESIFRGALFRHVRARAGGPLGLVLTVAVVASAFAIAHPYVLAGVIMVATLGGIFALMREWRGSLIAPMTAHCLHNSMVLMLLLSMISVMRG